MTPISAARTRAAATTAMGMDMWMERGQITSAEAKKTEKQNKNEEE